MGISLDDEVEFAARALEASGAHVEVRLDPSVRTLEGDHLPPHFLMRALTQLNGEAKDARCCNALYETALEDGKAKIMLSHDGRPVPGDVLPKLNRSLQEIADHTFTGRIKHGNLIVAKNIGQYRGRVYLENLPTGEEYTVRTTIEIPI